MNKRGQFYLIAALVIISVLIGLAAVYNVAQVQKEDTVVYDLSKEINFEAGQVIDSGIYNDISETDWHKNIENLTDYYSNFNKGNDFIIVYGNRSGMAVFAYTTKNTGSVGFGTGASSSTYDTIEVKKLNATFVPQEGDDSVTLIIPTESNNITHSFDIKPGQTFFVLIQKEKQGERYVSSSQPGSGI